MGQGHESWCRVELRCQLSLFPDAILQFPNTHRRGLAGSVEADLNDLLDEDCDDDVGIVRREGVQRTTANPLAPGVTADDQRVPEELHVSVGDSGVSAGLRA